MATGLAYTLGISGACGVLEVQHGRTGNTELSETALKVLVQEGVEHWIEAAVGVAEGNAEMPGDSLQEGAGNGHQGLDDDEDVDRRPADDENRHHHQDHSGDAPEVAVLLLGARQHAHTLQAEDH